MSSVFNSLSLSEEDPTPESSSLDLVSDAPSEESSEIAKNIDTEVDPSIQASTIDDLEILGTQLPVHPADSFVDIQPQESSSVDTQHQESPTEDTTMAANQLAIEESTILEDIKDLFEENTIKEIGSNIADHDEICNILTILFFCASAHSRWPSED